MGTKNNKTWEITYSSYTLNPPIVLTDALLIAGRMLS
jgi:hypothetical protein